MTEKFYASIKQKLLSSPYEFYEPFLEDEPDLDATPDEICEEFYTLLDDFELSDEDREQHEQFSLTQKTKFCIKNLLEDSYVPSPETLIRAIRSQIDVDLFKALYFQFLRNRNKYRKHFIKKQGLAVLIEAFKTVSEDSNNQNEAIQQYILNSIHNLVNSNALHKRILNDPNYPVLCNILCDKLYNRNVYLHQNELAKENRQIKAAINELIQSHKSRPAVKQYNQAGIKTQLVSLRNEIQQEQDEIGRLTEIRDELLMKQKNYPAFDILRQKQIEMRTMEGEKKHLLQKAEEISRLQAELEEHQSQVNN